MSEELLVTVCHSRSTAEVAALLAEQGLNIDYQNADGITALMAATLNLDIPIMALLLAQTPRPTVDLEDARRNTALNHVYLECVLNDEDALLPIINLLLDNGADANHTSEIDDTLLEWAAYNGHVAIVRRLLAVSNIVIGNALNDARAGLAQETENPYKYQLIINILNAFLNPSESVGSERDDQQDFRL